MAPLVQFSASVVVTVELPASIAMELSAGRLVQLPASLAGDGSTYAPYLYPSDVPVLFRVTVTVNRRTKHDRLIFSCEEPPAGATNVSQEIQVHESLYSLRPVDFGRRLAARLRDDAQEPAIDRIHARLQQLARFRRRTVQNVRLARQRRRLDAVGPQPEEIVWGAWVTLDELRTRLAEPRRWPFVPDGRMGIERWLAARDAGLTD